MRELRTLLPYIRTYRGTYAAGMAFIVTSNILLTLGPKFLQEGIDALDRHEPFAVVLRAIILLLAVAIIGGFARFGMRELLNGGSRRIEFDLRNTLYRHLQRLSADFHDRSTTGDLMARSTNDLLAVRMVIGPAVMYLVDTITRTIFVLPWMLGISPRLTALSLLPLIALPVAMVWFGSAIHRRTLAIQAQFSALSDFVHENLSGVRVVRAYRQESAELSEFSRLNEEYASRNMSLAHVAGSFHPIMGFLGGLGAVMVVWLGGRLVIAGTVTPGQFVAFGVYLMTLIWPMIALGWVVNLVQRGAASMGRINALLEEIPSVTSPTRPARLPPTSGARRLVAEGVWFQYPNARDRGWVLQDINFDLAPGRSLAIVGPTGSGKSTLADLLVRTWDPDRGRILIDGVDIRHLTLEELRRAIGFVPQETFLFSDTLRANILFGSPDDGRLKQVIETAQLTETVQSFPNGLETMLGERGINLSGGQKQRASIARALAKAPPIFILDDALSAVDASTETRILQGLRDALANRTSVIVSHRLAAVRQADWILVLDQGRVVEAGDHDDLIAREGRYWQLLNRQALEESLEGAEA